MSLASRSNVPASVETLVCQIEALDEKTKRELFRQLELAEKVPESPPELPKLRFSDFWGIGKGTYSDPDADDEMRIKQIDDYIRVERDSWER